LKQTYQLTERLPAESPTRFPDIIRADLVRLISAWMDRRRNGRSRTGVRQLEDRRFLVHFRNMCLRVKWLIKVDKAASNQAS
jgi:hypothetical protein